MLYIKIFVNITLKIYYSFLLNYYIVNVVDTIDIKKLIKNCKKSLDYKKLISKLFKVNL